MAPCAAKYVVFVLMLADASGIAQIHNLALQTSELPVSTSQALTGSRPRLISLDEGMAVIGAALEVRYRRHPREDCSHLVHDIYKRAGFPYKYADSSDLYAGMDAFQRVTQPQPGDLVVWKGHAAIVVNPAQHTFFSSTRTGLRVESYDLKYWKRRGTPRFYRYLTLGPPSLPAIIQTSHTEDSD